MCNVGDIGLIGGVEVRWGSEKFCMAIREPEGKRSWPELLGPM